MSDTITTFPAAPVFTTSGLYLIGSGWSAVMTNPYFSTTYMFYQSPIRGLAGPGQQIATDLTSLGINYRVINEVPPGAVDRTEAFVRGIAPSDAVTPRNTGLINNFNGRVAEAQAVIDSITTAEGEYVANLRFLSGNSGINTQVDVIAINKSWWNGTTSTQIEATIGTKASGFNSAIVDSRYMPVEAGMARDMGLVGQVSNDGRAVLVPMADLASSNFGYGVGQVMRIGGIGLFGVGLGFAGWDQYQAYVADGYQFGSQSLHTGIENGVTIGGPFVIGGGLWLAGAATFAAGTGIGGVAIGIGYLGYKLSQVPPYQPWPGDPVPDDVGTAIPVPAPAFPSVPFQNIAPASANLSPNPTALSPVVYNWMLDGGDQPAPVAPVVPTFDSAPIANNWTYDGSTSDFAALNPTTQIDMAGRFNLDPGVTNYNIGWGFTPPVDIGPNPFGDYGGGFGPPVVLDLTGNGINITQLGASTKYLDTAGDGFEHRTAWAGAGNGVLILDADGSGNVDNPQAFNFTRWDPTARTDMEALAHVFDTDHDGKLDAGDARFADFKVLVTNQDGTTTLKTLSELGITSIDLVTDNTTTTLADGSTIHGRSTFTRTDGTTGTAADVSLAYDAQGHVVQQTVTHNADGSTTLDVKALNADGSLAEETVRTTSADGLDTTLKFDNLGTGIFGRQQTDHIVVNADGSRIETVANFDAAGTLLDRTITTTSADHESFTVQRDQDGNGAFEQTETHAANADGSTTCTITDLNANGSTKARITYTTSADGLSTTTQTDVNGDGVYDGSRTDVTVIANDDSRVETVSDFSRNGALRGRTVTAKTRDGRAQTTTIDLDGDGAIDLTQISSIVVNQDGSSTTTQRELNRDGSLRDSTIIVLSTDGLSRTVQRDIDGNGTVDLASSDTVVQGADGSRTETMTERNGDGSLRRQVATWRAAEGRSREIDADTNGDGHLDSVETIAAQANGSSVDTLAALNADGSLKARTITTTSADGRVQTIATDVNGDGVADVTLVQPSVLMADGSSVTASTNWNADGSLRDNMVVTVSADDLSTTTNWDMTGAGRYDHTRTDVIAVNADGSRTETVTDFNGDGSLRGRTTVTTSADRNSVTSVSDFDGNGSADEIRTSVRNGDGSTTSAIAHLNMNGTLRDASSSATSADGLSVTTRSDVNGDGVYDRVQSDIIVLNADGSRSEAVTGLNANGTLHDRTVTTTSADGLSRTTQVDATGRGAFEHTQTDVAVLNADGSRIETVTNLNANGSLRDRSIVTTSASGLSVTAQSDLDGNGTIDATSSDVVVLNANGSRTETVQTRSANGALISSIVTTTSADGNNVSFTRDQNGDGVIDRLGSTVLNANGTTVATVADYNANGSLRNLAATTVSADGLTKITQHDSSGDGAFDSTETDVTVLNADGSRTETVSAYGADGSLRYRTVGTVSANGLTTTTKFDETGSGTFNLTRIDGIRLDANGDRFEALVDVKADGSVREQTFITTTAGGNVVRVEHDRDGNGVADQVQTTVRNGDGSVTTTGVDLRADGTVQDQIISVVSADGLSSSTARDRNGDGVYERVRVDVTVLNADGSRTETVTDLDAAGTAIDRTVLTTSADGLTTTALWDVDGNGSIDRARSDVTIRNADGGRTETVTDASGRYVATMSANGLARTTQWDTTGSGSFDQTATDVTVLNADGSRTETVTAYRADGTMMSKKVVTTSADGLTQTTQYDTTGSGHF